MRGEVLAGLTWARPDRVEDIQRNQELFRKAERVHKSVVVLPQTKGDGDLVRKPRHLEGTTGEQVALGRAELEHGLVRAPRDLLLVVHCGGNGRRA